MAVVVLSDGRGVHELPIDLIRDAGMVINASGVELDGECVTVVADGADSG